MKRRSNLLASPQPTHSDEETEEDSASHREALRRACRVSFEDHTLGSLSAVTGLAVGVKALHRTEMSG